MTKEEKFYLEVEAVGFQTVMEGNMLAIMAGASSPARGALYLYDTAYAMGFGAAKQMQRDGIDIQTLQPEKLSLIPQKERKRAP